MALLSVAVGQVIGEEQHYMYEHVAFQLPPFTHIELEETFFLSFFICFTLDTALVSEEVPGCIGAWVL